MTARERGAADNSHVIWTGLMVQKEKVEKRIGGRQSQLLSPQVPSWLGRSPAGKSMWGRGLIQKSEGFSLPQAKAEGAQILQREGHQRSLSETPAEPHSL